MAGVPEDPNGQRRRLSRMARLRSIHHAWKLLVAHEDRDLELRIYEIIGCPPSMHPIFVAVYAARGLDEATQALIDEFEFDPEEIEGLRDLLRRATRRA